MMLYPSYVNLREKHQQPMAERGIWYQKFHSFISIFNRVNLAASMKSLKKLIEYFWINITKVVKECQKIFRLVFCFQKVKNFVTQLPLAIEDDLIERPRLTKPQLETLFNIELNYQEIFNKIINYKKKNIKKKEIVLVFGDYDYNTYLKLKQKNINISQKTSDSDQQASKTVYSAIVDLYVKRFLSGSPLIHEKSLPSLKFIAFILALKLSSDEQIDNKNFQSFIPSILTVKRHQKMEVEFLRIMDWNTSIAELFLHNPTKTWDEKSSFAPLSLPPGNFINKFKYKFLLLQSRVHDFFSSEK